MASLNDVQRDALTRGIVEEFGDGRPRDGKYLFDQMTRVPQGTSAKRMSVGEFVSVIPGGELFVLFDPHPNNREFARRAAEYLGDQDALAFRIATVQVATLLRFVECDMYFLSLEGKLLAVGCHEDPVAQGERLVWVPVSD